MGKLSRLDYLQNSSTEELIAELARRRQTALGDCSDEELIQELAERPGVYRDRLPRIVEK